MLTLQRTEDDFQFRDLVNKRNLNRRMSHVSSYCF